MAYEAEIASYKLEKHEDGKRALKYNIRLLRHDVVGDYKIVRSWTNKKTGNMVNHETDWNPKNADKFVWKIIQKATQNNYKIVEGSAVEEKFSLEVLQAKMARK